MSILLAQAGVAASAAEKFLNQGLLGAAVVALVCALFLLWQRGNAREDFWITRLKEKDDAHAAERQRLQDEINRISAARTSDAQSVSTVLQEQIRKCTEALTNTANTVEMVFTKKP